VTAVVEGGEADPTASPITWSAADPARRWTLERLERLASGGAAAPLIVPFIGGALAAARSGLAPGEHADLPSVADVAPAHRLVFDAYARRQGR
jgi:hypothetical protein